MLSPEIRRATMFLDKVVDSEGNTLGNSIKESLSFLNSDQSDDITLDSYNQAVNILNRFNEDHPLEIDKDKANELLSLATNRPIHKHFIYDIVNEALFVNNYGVAKDGNDDNESAVIIDEDAKEIFAEYSRDFDLDTPSYEVAFKLKVLGLVGKKEDIKLLTQSDYSRIDMDDKIIKEAHVLAVGYLSDNRINSANNNNKRLKIKTNTTGQFVINS